MTEWIRCEDEMPPYEKRVLMWLVTLDPKNSDVVIGVRSFYEEGKFWSDTSTYRPMEWISHWMPLPEPPSPSTPVQETP